MLSWIKKKGKELLSGNSGKAKRRTKTQTRAKTAKKKTRKKKERKAYQLDKRKMYVYSTHRTKEAAEKEAERLKSKIKVAELSKPKGYAVVINAKKR